ncbi:MAG: hypothetical protein FJ388_22030, partial [Verrucomicrobia bacterium]|nr:hypothetical protein [Verrucomicrobiota bacterium]
MFLLLPIVLAAATAVAPPSASAIAPAADAAAVAAPPPSASVPQPAAGPPLAAEAPWKMHFIDNTSRGADGVKLADVNGDGLLDIACGWEEG